MNKLAKCFLITFIIIILILVIVSVTYYFIPKKIEAWQPGVIVIFENSNHIGIISDKRNRNGVPYLIHNAGQPKREEDALIK